MTFDDKIALIRTELKKELPGRKQQFLMAPEFRRSFDFKSPSKNAAIMICLFPGENDIRIVFIKRTDYDGPHGGQVSFPGGVYEETDTDFSETAIRETEEEIGVHCGKSGILGELTPLLIPVSNMMVHPYVGSFSKNPKFSINQREVSFLIIAGVSELLNPLSVEKEKWKLHGMEIEVPFYRVDGNIIWGATAMILSEFLAVISNSGLYPQFQYSGNDRTDT